VVRNLSFDHALGIDAQLIAVDPSELTAPISFPYARKHEKEFGHTETFEWAVD
jgi:hypothetical protein